MSRTQPVPSPEMRPVESSNIAAAGYVPIGDGDKGRLYVDFHGRAGQPARRYLYEGVPADVYHDLLSAHSAGQYLAQRIKGVYPHVLVDAALDVAAAEPDDCPARVTVSVTLSGGAGTQATYGFHDNEGALRAFGTFVGYSGPGIMSILGMITPPELQHLVDTEDAKPAKKAV